MEENPTGHQSTACRTFVLSVTAISDLIKDFFLWGGVCIPDKKRVKTHSARHGTKVSVQNTDPRAAFKVP